MTPGGAPAWLRAGRVGKPHGLDGSFYVSDPKPQLLDAGRALIVRGQMLRVALRKGSDRAPIIRLDGFADRGAAETLRGEELLAAREHAPPLGEDEWWEDELEGCTVRAAGRPIGVVKRLVALPSCEALEIERPDADPLLVPLVSDAVRSVDVEQRTVDVDLEFLGEQPGDGS
jgi:16S rRNA processing protein RimM